MQSEATRPLLIWDDVNKLKYLKFFYCLFIQ
jgi:hypothetical protein